jgi:hypothetical protein
VNMLKNIKRSNYRVAALYILLRMLNGNNR